MPYFYITTAWLLVAHAIGGILSRVPTIETYTGAVAAALFFLAYEKNTGWR